MFSGINFYRLRFISAPSKEPRWDSTQKTADIYNLPLWRLHKSRRRKGGGRSKNEEMAGTSWREIWQRIRQRFPKRIWGGRKEDDRLPASIETAIEVVCQPVDSFLSLPFVYSASRLTPFCRRAFHPARPSGPTEGLHLLTSPPDYFFTRFP